MRSPARVLTALFAAHSIAAARADGAIVELPLRHTKVAIEVTAFVAPATIEQVFANPFAEPVEGVIVVSEEVGAAFARMQGSYGEVTTFSPEFVADLPVAGRFYQKVLALAPGVQDPDCDRKLSKAEGKPALAALLASQQPSPRGR